MDISLAFKETVQSIIFHHKNVRDAKKSIILNQKSIKNSFITKADLIANRINELNKVILENREAYLNLSNLLINKNYMPNRNRDEIDFFAETMTNKCLQSIKELKERLLYSGMPQQTQEHNYIIIYIIEEYLKHVHKVYSEQKAIRNKKASEIRQVFKLKFWKRQIKKSDIKYCRYDSRAIENNLKTNRINSLEIQEIDGDLFQIMNAESQQLNSKDIQLFEAENEQLYNEFNTLTEEMKDIENKVVYISELQDIFSEKILYQDKSLEHVLTTVVGSTENVKEANEQIRNAIQRNAGFRVWILFFLLVLSFTLIFLDWYKP